MVEFNMVFPSVNTAEVKFTSRFSLFILTAAGQLTAIIVFHTAAACAEAALVLPALKGIRVALIWGNTQYIVWRLGGIVEKHLLAAFFHVYTYKNSFYGDDQA